MTFFRYSKNSNNIFTHTSLRDALSFGNAFDVFSTEEELRDNKNISLTDLAALFNAHRPADAPEVKKFADRTAAARRVFGALSAKFPGGTPSETEAPAPVSEAPAEGEAPAEAPVSEGRKSVFREKKEKPVKEVIKAKENLKDVVQRVVDGPAAKPGRKRGSGKNAGKHIYPLVKGNPRREGGHGHRSMGIILDKPGLSYEAYIEAGGRPQDLQWDLDRKWVEIK